LADQQAGIETRMFHDELYQVLIDEREREVEAELRVRRLLGGRRPAIRWPRGRPHLIRGRERPNR
jgi:hypothetical protein